MRQVSVLGGRSLRDGDGPVRLRSSRTVALVAYLAVHAGRPQPRARIAGLFWPDSAAEQALTNLRRELHHLRTALGDDASVVASARDLDWRDTPGCEVDVRVFARERAAAVRAAGQGDDAAVLAHAAAAVEAYRGELLPGDDDEWVVDARAELEQQCVELVDLVGATRRRTGDLAGAVETARRRVRLRPLDEVGHRTLIELHGALGDHAGAVRAYHRCASTLERELGIGPDPATRAALDRLTTRAPDHAAPRSTGAARLVGRGAELDLLAAVWREAAAGSPRLALVRGDPGVGKTRLVTELAGAVRAAGAVVATAQCVGTSERLALAPVADWLRAPEIRSSLGDLDAARRAEVERLVPPPDGPARPATEPHALADAWQRHRFSEGLARALVHTGRPTLLVLDNLHWCDAETLAFVAFGLALDPDAPLLVVATTRDDELGPATADWIERMRAGGVLTELALGPLDAAGTAALGEAVTGRRVTAEETALLQATTGGFPLHVVEVARIADAGDPLPAADLSTVLRERLARASAPAREVAALGAAVGESFTLDLLAEAGEHDLDTVVQAVDELWRRRILQEAGDGYDFSHDLLRDAAYAGISPPRRWLLHRRVAQALELLHAHDTDAVCARLAAQHARGGRPERALGFYRRAAEVAADRFAHGEAVRMYGEALAIVRAQPPGRDRDARELDLLEATAAPLTARDSYSSYPLRRTLERSVELAEDLDRPDSVLVGLLGLWASRFTAGDNVEAHRIACRALTLVSADSDLLGAAHFGVAGSSVSLGRPAEARRHFEHALTAGSRRPLSNGIRPHVHGRAWAAHAHWLLGDDDRALSDAREAVAEARAAGHTFSVAVTLAYAAILHQVRGDADELGGTVEELRRLCERYDFAYYREWALVLQGWVDGGPGGAELARRGVEHLSAQRTPARLPYWLALVAGLEARAGRPDAARTRLDTALADARRREDLWWLPEVLRLRAGHEEPAAARERLRAAAALAAEQGSVALLRRSEADLATLDVTSPAARGPAGPARQRAGTPASDGPAPRR